MLGNNWKTNFLILLMVLFTMADLNDQKVDSSIWSSVTSNRDFITYPRLHELFISSSDSLLTRVPPALENTITIQDESSFQQWLKDSNNLPRATTVDDHSETNWTTVETEVIIAFSVLVPALIFLALLVWGSRRSNKKTNSSSSLPCPLSANNGDIESLLIRHANFNGRRIFSRLPEPSSNAVLPTVITSSCSSSLPPSYSELDFNRSSAGAAGSVFLISPVFKELEEPPPPYPGLA